MSGRFAVSDVRGEDEVGGSSDTPNGKRASPPQSPVPPQASSKDPMKMDYLTVDNPSSNVDRNQLTVTSVASGNLALYEVLGYVTDELY